MASWLAGRRPLPVLYLLIVHVSYRYATRDGLPASRRRPAGRGFQLLQSLIAVGSGGFTGVGLMESKQKLSIFPRRTPILFLR